MSEVWIGSIGSRNSREVVFNITRMKRTDSKLIFDWEGIVDEVTYTSQADPNKINCWSLTKLILPEACPRMMGKKKCDQCWKMIDSFHDHINSILRLVSKNLPNWNESSIYNSLFFKLRDRLKVTARFQMRKSSSLSTLSRTPRKKRIVRLCTQEMTKLNQSLVNVSATASSRTDKDPKNMKSSRTFLYKWSNCMARKID